MNIQLNQPSHLNRIFLPKDFKLKDGADVIPFFEQLVNEEIKSINELKQWLLKRSELESAIAEDIGWRYINMTRDTNNSSYVESYTQYVQDILPKVLPFSHQLDKKLAQSPYKQAIMQEAGYELLFRSTEAHLACYKPENIALISALRMDAQAYSAHVSKMTIHWDGKELTLPEAADYLASPNRTVRQNIYEKIQNCRFNEKDALGQLYAKLVSQRHQLAKQAGFENFIDYMFIELKRFDYTPQDCLHFHDSVKKTVLPALNTVLYHHKTKAKLDILRIWDWEADPLGRPPLCAFEDTNMLVQKTITVLDQLHPFFGDCLRTMLEMGHLDLESRKAKAPGGYNYPLPETKVPFIFMNASRNFLHVITLLHESGHAVHNFMMNDLPLNAFKEVTSEMAELASMTMELLTMDHWDLFFTSPRDAKRAKKEHLENIIKRLVWIAMIDKFQHLVYKNAIQQPQAYEQLWLDIVLEFQDNETTYLEDKKFLPITWQKQLHLFEVPLYYIEYGIAQLGALAIWKNYKKNPQKTRTQYIEALKLGYTQSLSVMYQTAGIKLDFSREYIAEIIHFVMEEWQKVAEYDN